MPTPFHEKLELLRPLMPPMAVVSSLHHRKAGSLQVTCLGFGSPGMLFGVPNKRSPGEKQRLRSNSLRSSSRRTGANAAPPSGPMRQPLRDSSLRSGRWPRLARCAVLPLQDISLVSSKFRQVR